MLLAELHEPLCPLLTKAGLQTPRLVVDAAVDHAAVVTGLVAGPACLLLEHHYACARVTLQKRPGTREPDDTAAYHREVVHRQKPPLSGYVSPSRSLYTAPMSLTGVCTITLTPFTEGGDVDLESIDSLAGLYLDSGVYGLTILGIMGEAHKLSDEERSMVVGRYIEAARGRVPVVVGCSAVATKVTVERAREAETAGAAAIMVAPPNNVRNLDLVFEHYRRVAEAVSVPVVVQDEPVNTGVVMHAPFLARLVDGIEGCRYVKLEEAPTTIKISSLLERTESGVGVFGGLGGMYFYEELGRGAVGIMTGFAYPHVLVETYRLFAGGQQRKAQEYFFRYLPLIRFEAQLGVGGVGIRKEILKLRGVIDSSHVRFPAPSLDEKTLRELEDLVAVLGLAD